MNHETLTVQLPVLPIKRTVLLLVHPLQSPLRSLDAKELDILQLALNFGHVATILNKSPATDLETAKLILKLISGSYLQAQ